MEVFLLSAGLAGEGGQAPLAKPISPAALAAVHPLWAADLTVLKPRDERPAFPPGSIVVCGPCGSTMDVARVLCREGRLAAWGSVLAPVQTAGRGQLRRGWMSGAGNMFATLVCPPAKKPWDDLRPLLFGHLFSLALSRLGPAVNVKWPNDLLCDDRKIAGMLVEERGGCVILGIGVNLVWAPGAGDLRGGHAVAAGRYLPSDPGIGPLRLWRALVNLVETGYEEMLAARTPKEFLMTFRSRLAWAGRRVLVHEGIGVRYEAVIKGVSEEGGLVLDRAGEEVVLLAGDVTPLS